MTKKICLFVIATAITIASFSQNLDSGLVGCYPFSSNALDLSGNNHNGVVSGAQLTTDRFNNSNSAYHFNGTSDYIAINNFDSLISQDEWSISFWEKADLQTSNCPFVLSPANLTDRLVLGTKYKGQIYFDYGNIEGTGRTIAKDTFNSNWNHYVFVISNKRSLKQVYRNDTLVLNTNLLDQLTNWSRTLLIGGGSDVNNGNIRFHGSIDDIRIYNRPLNGSEVTELFNMAGSNCQPLPVSRKCLVACLPLNGNGIDLSGYNHNGIVNGPLPVADRNGNPNSAMHFNGLSDNITITNFDSIVTGEELTISCWAKADLETSNSLFMLTADSIQDRFVGSVEYNGNVYFDYGDIYNGGRSTIKSAYDTRWNHYIFTMSKTNDFKRFYKNDTLLINSTFGTNHIFKKGKALIIGAGNDVNGQNIRFHGSISNFEIYNCSMDSADAAHLYHSNGCQNVLGIANIADVSLPILAFPNPTAGKLTIQYPKEVTGKVKVELYNLVGQHLITYESRVDNGTNAAMDFPASAKPGMYILIVTFGNEKSVQRIVLEK